MALFLTDAGHLDLQQYFMKWAPRIPPRRVRKMLLGFVVTDTEDLDEDSESVNESFEDLSLSRDMAEGILSYRPSDDAEDPDDTKSAHGDDDPSSASPEEDTTTASALYWETSHESRLYGRQSIWGWTPVDEKNAIEARERSLGRTWFPEAQNTFIGGLQLEALERIQAPVVTSVDDALRYIQEVQSSAEIRSVIEAISSWAAMANQKDLQDFNKSCEVFPHTMWVQVSTNNHILI